MTSAEIATLSDPGQIDAASDPGAYVVLACERAKSWLTDALKHGEIDRIVEIKSSAEAIRVYTAQKQIGRDAELAAAEVVRRAERGLGLAIRRGQEAGEIATRADHMAANQHMRRALLPDEKKTSPVEFFNGGADQSATYAMTDDVTDEQFEGALVEAREEQNLSRANVVRKVRAAKVAAVTESSALAAQVPERGDRSVEAVVERRRIIREMAEGGYSSRQISERLGTADDTVRKIARECGIDIPADEVVGRTRRLDSNRIVRETVAALDGLAMGAQLVKVADLEPSEVDQWATSLTKSIRVLNRLVKEMKEMAQ